MTTSATIRRAALAASALASAVGGGAAAQPAAGPRPPSFNVVVENTAEVAARIDTVADGTTCWAQGFDQRLAQPQSTLVWPVAGAQGCAGAQAARQSVSFQVPGKPDQPGYFTFGFEPNGAAWRFRFQADPSAAVRIRMLSPPPASWTQGGETQSIVLRIDCDPAYCGG